MDNCEKQVIDLICDIKDKNVPINALINVLAMKVAEYDIEEKKLILELKKAIKFMEKTIEWKIKS